MTQSLWPPDGSDADHAADGVLTPPTGPGGTRAIPSSPTPDQPSAKDALVGRLLGDCLITRRVAVGGMGAVYAGTQQRLNRQVAVKVVAEHLAAQPQFLQRFEREARAAAALNHPGIVQVHDFGEDNGRPYLVMEYVEGEDLAAYLRTRTRLPVREALDIVEQVARALQAAAEKQIIHRDIKPANLLRTPSGQIKVLDLGLAKNISQDTDVTATGVGLGSPLFLAPEQADDARHVDHRADIYSLGITLLYLLTGRHPFAGSSAFSVVLAHASKPLPSGAELGTELPAPVESLIARMAAKRAEDRYQNYADLLADLARVQAGQAPFLSGLRLGRIPRRVWLPWCLALVAILAALAAWRWPRPSVEPAAPASASTQTPLPPAATPPPPTAKSPPRNPFLEGKNLGKAADRSALLPPLPQPNFTPLKEGPLGQMLAEAEAYAKDHPTHYVEIINRYLQLSAKAGGTPLGPQVRQALDEWLVLHHVAADKAIEDHKHRMNALLQAGNRAGAFAVWREFPVNLRTPEVDAEIRRSVDLVFPPGERSNR